MKTVLLFIAISLSINCFAISDMEMGVIACIERTTNLDIYNNDNETGRIVNEIFNRIGVRQRYNPAIHSNVLNRYTISDSEPYSFAYAVCERYIQFIDPDGSKYQEYE